MDTLIALSSLLLLLLSQNGRIILDPKKDLIFLTLSSGNALEQTLRTKIFLIQLALCFPALFVFIIMKFVAECQMSSFVLAQLLALLCARIYGSSLSFVDFFQNFLMS